MAISTRHPAARSPFASRCRVARASATRLLLMLAIPDAAVFRMSEGSSGFDGSDSEPSDATSTRNPLTRAMESSPRAQRQTRSNHVTATIMPVEQDPNPPKRLSGGYQHEHRAEYLAAIARVSPPVRIPGAPPSSSNFFSKIGRWGDCEAPRRAGSSCFGRAARPAERGMG